MKNKTENIFIRVSRKTRDKLKIQTIKAKYPSMDKYLEYLLTKS